MMSFEHTLPLRVINITLHFNNNGQKYHCCKKILIIFIHIIQFLIINLSNLITLQSYFLIRKYLLLSVGSVLFILRFQTTLCFAFLICILFFWFLCLFFLSCLFRLPFCYYYVLSMDYKTSYDPGDIHTYGLHDTHIYSR